MNEAVAGDNVAVVHRVDDGNAALDRFFVLVADASLGNRERLARAVGANGERLPHLRHKEAARTDFRFGVAFVFFVVMTGPGRVAGAENHVGAPGLERVPTAVGNFLRFAVRRADVAVDFDFIVPVVILSPLIVVLPLVDKSEKVAYPSKSNLVADI